MCIYLFQTCLSSHKILLLLCQNSQIAHRNTLTVQSAHLHCDAQSFLVMVQTFVVSSQCSFAQPQVYVCHELPTLVGDGQMSVG